MAVRSVMILAAVVAAACSVSILVQGQMELREARKRKESIRSKIGGISEAVRVGESPWLLPLSGIMAKLGKTRGASRIDMARDLPELIDAIRLGLEGGMSFEASFSLYSDRFDSGLARACQPAARLMATGVEGREQALGRLADELDSPAFRRFAGTVSRSMRYGAQLSPALNDLASDMREAARADREEAVAKAPTKMLLPTGVFILPATMMLIAGPFLLELIEQM